MKHARIVRSLGVLSLLLGLMHGAITQAADGTPSSGQVNLEPTSVTVSATSVRWFDAMTIAWTVRNRSGFAIPADATWTEQVRLSVDTTLNFDDPFFGVAEFRQGPLDAGGSYADKIANTVPVIPEGTYHVLVAVALVSGLDEGGPTFSVAVGPTITVSRQGVDLRPIAVTPSSTTVRWGEKARITWTATNAGPDAIPAGARWYDEIYLSTNRTLDRLDRPLGNTEHKGPLAAGDRYVSSADVTVPAIASGTYYLLVELDISSVQTGDYTPGHGNLPESDEGNNVGVGATIEITTSVDLVPETLTASTGTAKWGDQIGLDWSIANRGAGAMPAGVSWYDAVYLSFDKTLDSRDVPLGAAEAHGPVAAGGSYTHGMDAVVPFVPAGTYYLLLAADHSDYSSQSNALTETDETNNVLVGPSITIAALNLDLVPTKLTADKKAVGWGDPLTVEWTVVNRGSDTTPAGATWYDTLYLSTDAKLDAGDIPLWSCRQEKVAATGGSYSSSTRWEDCPGCYGLPLMPSGTYHLLLAVDGGNDLGETDETNNILVGPTVTVAGVDTDLAPTEMTVKPASASLGDTITVQWTVANRGVDPFPSHVVEVADSLYLSRDTTLSEDDVQLDAGWFTTSPHGPVPAGGTYPVEMDVAIPDVPPGHYYLLAAVEFYPVPCGIFAYQTDEANDVVAIPFTVQAASGQPAVSGSPPAVPVEGQRAEMPMRLSAGGAREPAACAQ